ncbi:hypothetical protein K7X08_024988 [Anisodus acutangulus]|uniref:Uncharacterized protein n=1 Tax=Anisodus acutangulus TaxID=402998 RepID=A0A9Q1M8X8_9SOLA|nr:hypothetical protein K7X08_024988 [Anisodus acutangulus]
MRVLIHVDDIEPLLYGNQEQVLNVAVATVYQQNENMVVDSILPVHDTPNAKTQQLDEREETIFDDTLAGREARELYLLSKMGFGDTNKEGDFEKYFERMAAASRHEDPTEYLKTQQGVSHEEKISEEVCSILNQSCDKSPSKTVLKEVENSREKVVNNTKKQQVNTKVEGNKKNWKHLVRANVVTEGARKNKKIVEINDNLVDVEVTDLCSPYVRDKRKGGNVKSLTSDME